MADKPKYQHELAERLSKLALVLSHNISKPDKEEEEEPSSEPPSLLYVKAFWATICREWTGLDRLRLNKFYYLMQQFLKIGFEMTESQGFCSEYSQIHFTILQKYPLNLAPSAETPKAILVFVIENYVATLRSLGNSYDEELSVALMAPLVETLLAAREKPLLKVLEEAFTQMIESESNNDESFLNLSKLGPLLFDVGANPEALALNRKLLYKLSDSIKGATSTKLEVSNSSPANPVEH